MVKWIDITDQLPTDGITVWARIGNYYGDALKCTFDLTTQLFTSIDTGFIIPAYMIARWKPISGINTMTIGKDFVVA